MKVIIYSDGGADPNPGIGGWGVVLKYGEHERELSGNDSYATNNQMELTAVIEALKVLKRPCEIDFYLDSQYVRRGISQWISGWATNGWKKRNGDPIQNVELWQQLWPLSKQHQVQWHWVKGHAGNKYNERVDELARAARLAITPKIVVDENAPRLYVRSSCIGNPGPGGWGVVMEDGDDIRQMSGNVLQTTNNRMEVLAAVEAVSLPPQGSSMQIFTTSDYLFQGATQWIKGWRKRDWKKRDGTPIANGDLWQRLNEVMNSAEIRWINAKGQKHPSLDVAGKLASSAARELKEQSSR